MALLITEWRNPNSLFGGHRGSYWIMYAWIVCSQSTTELQKQH